MVDWPEDVPQEVIYEIENGIEEEIEAISKAIDKYLDGLSPQERKRLKMKDSAMPVVPLYINRPVLNPKDIATWAKQQGFTHLIRDMHTTQLFSKTPVDFAAMASPLGRDPIHIDGGKRSLEKLGPDGAVVLKFESMAMQRRFQELMERGASFDYDKFQPHITLTYTHVPDDISQMEAYSGPILLAPEIFAEIDMSNVDWKPEPEDVA